MCGFFGCGRLNRRAFFGVPIAFSPPPPVCVRTNVSSTRGSLEPGFCAGCARPRTEQRFRIPYESVAQRTPSCSRVARQVRRLPHIVQPCSHPPSTQSRRLPARVSLRRSPRKCEYVLWLPFPELVVLDAHRFRIAVLSRHSRPEMPT